jgi:type II secretory pathway component PulM
LLKVAVGALVEQFGTVGQIIAATSHPLGTKKTVQIALSDKGTRERKMLLQAQGFLPHAERLDHHWQDSGCQPR